ncbi:MAG: hypothetical protein IPM69_14885 [Ignavibacteria bacterium]|nr:hypothetical protein [Ignavibacteria bacterium]
MLRDHVVAGSLEETQEMWEAHSPLFAIFMSSTESAETQTNDFVLSSLDGGRLELLNCGASATTMGTNVLQVSPYSTRLRPVTNLSKFKIYRKIYLTKITFNVLDTTLTGAIPQDAQVDTEISDSLITNNDAYVQSRFRFGTIGNWQPNFFRPSVSLKNGDDIFETMVSSNFDDKDNLGDMSIGPMLPYEYIPPIPHYLGQVLDLNDAIREYAKAGQIVQDTVAGVKKIQRYPIHCQMEFLGIK